MLPRESTKTKLGQGEAKKTNKEQCKSPKKILKWNWENFMPYV